MQHSKPLHPVATSVADVLERYPVAVREKLLALRAVILEVAAEENIWPVEETLKWGQPAYLCTSGTTIRIDHDQTHGGDIALYVNCKTSLVSQWRERFADFSFGGDRSLHLRLDDDFDDARLKICIGDALLYHRRKGKT